MRLKWFMIGAVSAALGALAALVALRMIIDWAANGEVRERTKQPWP